jgi:hypothetical protein
MINRAGGLCLIMALFCGSVAAVAQAHRTDPIVGTWKLNLSQSRMPQMPGMPKEQIEIYRESSPGQLELTLSRTFKGTIQGKPMEIVAVLDRP